ncbi:MAG: hypothetical protein QM767_04415 [Anaeromyxobacter sp.]
MSGSGGLFGTAVATGGPVQRLLQRVTEGWQARAARRALARDEAEPRRPLVRSRLEAELSARLAVRSGVRLDDFLRYRLARYATRLPVALEVLPVDLDVQDGEVVVRSRHPAPRAAPRGAGGTPAPPPPAPEPPARAAAAAALIAASDRLLHARAHAEALTRAVADDLVRGALPVDPEALAATPEQRGRPPVPLPWLPLGLRALAGALLASETLRLSGPALRAAGAPPDLPAALASAPLAGGAGLAFALGGAVALFALVAAGAERWVQLLAAAGERRRALVALTAAGGGAAALAVAAASLSAAPAAELVWVAALPIAAVLLLRRAAWLWARREEALGAALAWDREQARDAAERARRGEALARAQATVAALEAEEREAERRLRTLEREAEQSTRLEAGQAAARARWLERLAESLAAALELDRYAFLRRRASDGELLRSARSSRPARLETDRLGIAG